MRRCGLGEYSERATLGGTHVGLLVSRHGGVIYRRLIDRHRMNDARNC